MSDTNATPARVASAANRADAIDLRSVALLGVFSDSSGVSALLRFANGRITKVVPGQQTPEGQVVMIGGDTVVLATRSGQTRLQLP